MRQRQLQIHRISILPSRNPYVFRNAPHKGRDAHFIIISFLFLCCPCPFKRKYLCWQTIWKIRLIFIFIESSAPFSLAPKVVSARVFVYRVRYVPLFSNVVRLSLSVFFSYKFCSQMWMKCFPSAISRFAFVRFVQTFIRIYLQSFLVIFAFQHFDCWFFPVSFCRPGFSPAVVRCVCSSLTLIWF